MSTSFLLARTQPPFFQLHFQRHREIQKIADDILPSLAELFPQTESSFDFMDQLSLTAPNTPIVTPISQNINVSPESQDVLIQDEVEVEPRSGSI